MSQVTTLPAGIASSAPGSARAGSARPPRRAALRSRWCGGRIPSRSDVPAGLPRPTTGRRRARTVTATVRFMSLSLRCIDDTAGREMVSGLRLRGLRPDVALQWDEGRCRHRRRAVRGCGHGAAAGPGRSARADRGPRGLRHRHALDPCADARRGAAAAPVGRAARRGGRRHASRLVHDLRLRTRYGRGRHRTEIRGRGVVRAAPAAARRAAVGRRRRERRRGGLRRAGGRRRSRRDRTGARRHGDGPAADTAASTPTS